MANQRTTIGHPPGCLTCTIKPTTELAPGDSVRVPGLGALTIAAAPITMPHRRHDQMLCVPLGWSRLAILAASDAQWDATSLNPPIWQHRSCPACGGSGRCPDPWNWKGQR